MQKALSDKLIEKKIKEAKKRDEIVKILKSCIYDRVDTPFNLDEIEQVSTELFKELRVQSAREIIAEQDVKEWNCPNCGSIMTNKEKVPHIVKGLANYEFRIRYFHCESCGANEKPAKKLMGCIDGFTTKAKESIVLLGQRIPFEEASLYLKNLIGMSVSAEYVRKLTENVGKKLYHQEEQRVIQLVSKNSGKIQTSSDSNKMIDDTAYLEIDGCMVQTREDGWKEAKNGILFRASNKTKKDKHHNQIEEKRYFSKFSDCEAFKHRTTQAAYDFGFHDFKKQVVLADGAPWIWDYFTKNHPDAIQILDYYHASEYLGEAVQSMKIKEDSIKQAVIKRMFRKLRAGHIERIVNWLDKQEKTKEINDCCRYFWKNKDRMRYRAYRRQGFSIGSGAIESAHRIIVQTRMKQSGMHWGKDNVQSILSLRAAFLSGLWSSIICPIIKDIA